jgi:hypothetical protein
MKKKIKSIIRNWAGLENSGGTPIDLTYGGPLRVQSTVEPAEKCSFNDVWKNIARLNSQNC